MPTKKKVATKKTVIKKTTVKKKPAKKKVAKKLPVKANIKVVKGREIDLEKEKPIGEIIHYYGKIKVGVVEVYKGQQISVGETIYYSGHTTDFDDILQSIQEYDQRLDTVKGKKQVGIKVKKKVRTGDKVFKITHVG